MPVSHDSRTTGESKLCVVRASCALRVDGGGVDGRKGAGGGGDSPCMNSGDSAERIPGRSQSPTLLQGPSRRTSFSPPQRTPPTRSTEVISNVQRRGHDYWYINFVPGPAAVAWLTSTVPIEAHRAFGENPRALGGRARVRILQDKAPKKPPRRSTSWAASHAPSLSPCTVRDLEHTGHRPQDPLTITQGASLHALARVCPRCYTCTAAD